MLNISLNIPGILEETTLFRLYLGLYSINLLALTFLNCRSVRGCTLDSPRIALIKRSITLFVVIYPSKSLYGYQYGPNGTIEILINGKWCVFAIMVDAV